MRTKLHSPRLFNRRQVLASLAIVLIFCALFAGLFTNDKAKAATASTINFQARLMNASGSIAPDGYYNIQFKLYDALSGGTLLFTDTYYDSNGVTAGNDDRIKVANGYLTVTLGGPSNPFPSTIKWDQELWLTMNVGDTTQTATPTWDGEMSPRLKLTAVPFAFRAGALAGGTGANTTVLDTGTPSGSHLLHLPTEDGTLCVQGATSCGFVAGTATGFIQNNTSVQTNANFNIRSAGTGSVTGVLQGANGQAADLFDAQTFNGTSATTVFAISNLGDLSVQGVTLAADKSLTLQNGTGIISQTYTSNTNNTSAQVLAFTNSNSTSTSTTVSGISITPTGSANSNSNANKLNAITLPDVTPVANNAFYGINIGTGYDDILRYNGTRLISGTGKVQDAAIDSSVTYSNLQKVGTINTGTWQGTAVGVAYGGTGQTTYTDGQLLIGNSSGNTLTKATLTGTANRLGVTNGNGSITLNVDATQFPSSTGGNTNYVLRASGANAASWVSNTQANVCSDCATRALDNLSSVAINAALGFQSNQAANINFNGAAAAAGNALTITGQSAGGAANAGGDITIQGGTATGATQGGTTTVRGGNTAATGTNGTLTLDAGSGATTPNGTINLGTANASIINIGSVGSTAKATTIHLADSTGNVTQAITIGVSAAGGANAANNTLVLDAGTASNAIQIGNSAQAHGIQVGTGAAVQTVVIGSTNSTSSLSLQVGTGNLDIGNDSVAKTTTINIGNDSTGADIIALGSSHASSTTSIQGGSGITLSTATGNKVQVGSSTSDANVSLFGLDSYNSASDPTGFAGAMYYNSNAGVLAFRCYQNGAWANCINTSAGGVSSIGTIDTPTTSADGAHITGNTLYLQSATASVPGLVNITTQTFAGDKTFTGNLTVQGTTGLTFNTGAGGDITFANSEKIDNDTNGQINLQANSGGLTLLLTGSAATITNSAGTLTLNSFNDTLTVDSSDTTLSATGINTVNLGSTTSFSTGGTSRLMLDGSNNLYLGNANTSGVAASPNAFMLRGTGSSTAATAGALLTVIGGTGNTSGLGGGVTIQGGTGGNAASGGQVKIQGGNAGGGTTNGANVLLTGGTGTSGGVMGLVVIDTPTITTSSTQTCSSTPCTITQANIDSSGAVLINATIASATATLSDPTITTAGKLMYVTNVGSNDFTLSVNGGGTGNTVAMKPSTTATMIWNGSDWTAAGASSSTDLQSAYNNTLTSAGGAELIVSNGSNANGLTIRDSLSSPISGNGNGTLLEVQTGQAASLFSVNSSVTDYANNGGAENTFGAEWAAIPSSGATISRNTNTTYIATGTGSTSIATNTSANSGAANKLTATLTANLRYNVSFATKLTSGSAAFTDIDVEFSKDGTTTGLTACSNYSTHTAATSVWSKVNCTFTAPSSGITSSNAIFIRQTASGTSRTFYVDNLSVTISADLNYATDGGVDDNTNFTTNWTAVAGTGATVTAIRSTTNGNDTSDSAEAHITVGGSGGNNGIRNKLSINPLTSTLYRISVYASSSTAMTDFTVRYSRDGGTNFDSCVDYNTQSLSGTITSFTQVTCYITTSGTAPSNPYVYFTESGTGVRDIYVDTFTMTIASNAVPNVQVGGGVNGGPTTLFTLDRAASAPIAASNDALLGSMYYDTTLGKLQCYESDGWGACGSSPDNIITISPEYTNAVLHGPSGGTTGVGTMTSDLCSDALNINDGSSSQPTICGSNETYNFYKWTSPQIATAQTYAIYVTYQLPTTFKSFASGSTSIKGRTDSSNATVAYKVYRNAGSGSGLTQCGSAVTVSTGSVSSWQPGLATGTADPSTCSFVGGDSIVFEIDMTASNNANAYVSNLGFTFSNK